MSYQNACYNHAPDIRLRPLPEMQRCLVYVPVQAELYVLNSTSWLVLELCDGADLNKIVHGFHREVEPLITLDCARDQVLVALDDLVRMQIVQIDAVATVGSETGAAKMDKMR